MKIRILGAGFSGLTLAYLMIRKGFEVEVCEKSDHLGGLIQTSRVPQLFSESAANGLMANDEILAMFKELNLEYVEAQKSSAKRYIYRNRPRRWPLSILETIVMTFTFLKQRFKRQHLPQPLETVETWGKRVLGKAATNYLLQPALQGIYAGDISQMSASLILGKFFNGKKSKWGKLIAPKEGMGSLFIALKKYIQEHGGQIKFNFINSEDDQEIPTLSAISSKEYKSSAFNQLKLLSLIKVTVQWRNPQKRLDGYGVLFPRDQGVRALGVLANDSIFGRPEELNSESWIYGGATDLKIIDLLDEEIIALIRKDREILFGTSDQIESYKISRWPQTLPHYNLELEKHLDETSNETKMRFSGNFMGELGLSRIFNRNIAIAEYWKSHYGI